MSGGFSDLPGTLPPHPGLPPRGGREAIVLSSKLRLKGLPTPSPRVGEGWGGGAPEAVRGAHTSSASE